METQEFHSGSVVMFRRATMRYVLILFLVWTGLTVCSGVLIHDLVTRELYRACTGYRALADGLLGDKITLLRYISSSAGYSGLVRAGELERVYGALHAADRSFAGLEVLDREAGCVVRTGFHEPDLPVPDREKGAGRHGVLDRDTAVSDFFPGIRGVPYVAVTVRCPGTDGIWYLRAVVDTWPLRSLLESVRLGSTGEAYLVSRRGILQTARRSGQDSMETDPDFREGRWAVPSPAVSFTGHRWVAAGLDAGLALEHADWYLVVRQGVNDAYMPVVVSAAVSLLVLAGGAFLAAVAGGREAGRRTEALREPGAGKRGDGRHRS